MDINQKRQILRDLFNGKATVKDLIESTINKYGTIWIETEKPGYFKNPKGNILTRSEISTVSINRNSFQIIVQ